MRVNKYKFHEDPMCASCRLANKGYWRFSKRTPELTKEQKMRKVLASPVLADIVAASLRNAEDEVRFLKDPNGTHQHGDVGRLRRWEERLKHRKELLDQIIEVLK